jgi:hypothetical protein
MQSETRATPAKTGAGQNEPAGVTRSEFVEQQAEVLDTAVLAKRLLVCEATVKNWRSSGKLPYIVLGRSVRFLWPSVVEALRRQERRGGAA